jgi:hypothetical protein
MAVASLCHVGHVTLRAWWHGNIVALDSVQLQCRCVYNRLKIVLSLAVPLHVQLDRVNAMANQPFWSASELARSMAVRFFCENPRPHLHNKPFIGTWKMMVLNYLIFFGFFVSYWKSVLKLWRVLPTSTMFIQCNLLKLNWVFKIRGHVVFCSSVCHLKQFVSFRLDMRVK